MEVPIIVEIIITEEKQKREVLYNNETIFLLR